MHLTNDHLQVPLAFYDQFAPKGGILLPRAFVRAFLFQLIFHFRSIYDVNNA